MSRPRVLLVGWQAADWKLLHPLLDGGEMPHLEALLSRGAMGTLVCPLPLIPALLWSSLATGRRAAGHGILNSWKLDAKTSKLARTPLGDRNCPAFWDVLQASGLKTHLINWPLSDPAEKTGGVSVSDTFFAPPSVGGVPSPAGKVHPESAGEMLAGWRISPQEVDAGTIKFFVPDLGEIPRDHNDRLSRIADAAARVFSVQAVTTWLMENREWDVTAVRFELLDELAGWALPLTAPKLEAVGQREFEAYRHVLSSACKLLDLMLGTLVKMAGSETVIILVSDHGLLLGDARPRHGPVNLHRVGLWQRREGIVVLAGSIMRPDEVIFGARLLDIMPTLLTMLEVPLSSGLEGRVLAEAFAQEIPPPLHETLPISWASRGESGSGVPLTSSTKTGQALWLDQQWNLVRSLLDGGKVVEALEVVEALRRLRPENLDFMRARFECQLALRRIEPARESLECLLDYLWGTPQAALYQARLEYAARRFDRSLEHLETIEQTGVPFSGVHLQVGLNLIKLNQSARARVAFERELTIQPASAEAHAGLAYVCLRAGQFDLAIDHALEAIGLQYNLPYAHFILGLAQARKGDMAQAQVAFRLVTALDPGFAPAHRCLAILYGRDPHQQELAQRHKDLAQAAKNWGWGF